MSEQEKPKRKNKPGAGGRRAKSGRKIKPEVGAFVYMQITMPAAMRDYAKKQEGGASAYIRRLIAYDQHIEDFFEKQKLVENSSK